jgi:hypothetical protein
MRIKSISLAIIAALTLSGCSAPLTSSDLSIELNAGEWAYSLTGDEALLEGSIEISNGSNQNLEAVLEIKDGDSDWNELEVKALGEGEPNVSFSVLVEEAGDFEFRLSARSPSSEIISSSTPVTVSVGDLKLLVRNLYYDARITCEESASACRAFYEENNYPGLFDYSDPEVSRLFDNTNWSSDATPDVDSIIQDQDWRITKDQCLPWLTSDAEPSLGRTFLVTITDSFGPYDVHTTFLNGKVYWFVVPGC